MTETIRIVGVGGSLAETSRSLLAVHALRTRAVPLVIAIPQAFRAFDLA